MKKLILAFLLLPMFCGAQLYSPVMWPTDNNSPSKQYNDSLYSFSIIGDSTIHIYGDTAAALKYLAIKIDVLNNEIGRLNNLLIEAYSTIIADELKKKGIHIEGK